MTQRPVPRRGLGRGLGSLIPTGPRPEEDRADGSSHGDPVRNGGSGSPVAPQGPDWIGHPHRAGSDATGAPPAPPLERSWEPDDGAGRGTGTEHSADPADPTGSAASAGSSPSDDPSPAPGLAPVTGAFFAELAITDVRPNPRQPREVFDEDAMAELVHSVREVGLLQPVVVRPVTDGGYELVMGERRWRASREAGLETIPAIVRETGDDDLLRDALLENLHRAELNALEEAAAYQQLLDDFGCTHDELAQRIGRSRPQISNTLRLLRLSPAVQRRVAAGVLSAGHARALLGVEDPDTQDRLAGRVVAEGISVRGLEEIVSVGDLPEGERRVRRSRPTAPGLEDLSARLSDRLETRVKVDLGRRKGRITVEFASIPDLERIVGLIDPDPASTSR